MAVLHKNRRSSKGLSATGRVMFWGGLGLFASYLLFFLVFGRLGVINHMSLKEEAGRLDAEIAEWSSEIVTLTGRVDALNHDPQAIEQLARQRLGMVKKGETVFLFETPAPTPAGRP